MKKLLFILLTTILLSNSKVAAYDFSVDGFNYNFLNNTEVILVSPNENMLVVKIPSSVSYRGKEFKVKKIAKESFINRGIQLLSIPEGIEEIGDRAFEKI